MYPPAAAKQNATEQLWRQSRKKRCRWTSVTSGTMGVVQYFDLTKGQRIDRPDDRSQKEWPVSVYSRRQDGGPSAHCTLQWATLCKLSSGTSSK